MVFRLFQGGLYNSPSQVKHHVNHVDHACLFSASRIYGSLRSEHKFLSMVGQLALWKYGRGYALYENGELIAVFMYRKGPLHVAELLAQACPMRFGKAVHQSVINARSTVNTMTFLLMGNKDHIPCGYIFGCSVGNVEIS